MDRSLAQLLDLDRWHVLPVPRSQEQLLTAQVSDLAAPEGAWARSGHAIRSPVPPAWVPDRQ